MSIDLGANREPWTDRAQCRLVDPEIFFPDPRGSGGEAKAICACCRVSRECLDYALREDIPCGVWGGMTSGERRDLTRTPAVITRDCGTERGASRHYRRRERLCAGCLAALAARSRKQRAVGSSGVTKGVTK